MQPDICCSGALVAVDGGKSSVADRHFFRKYGFQIFCGSLSATTLPTSPLVPHSRTHGSPIGSEVSPTIYVNLKTSTAYHTCISVYII